MQTGNLLADSSPPATGEIFDTLLEHRNLVIERILSSDGSHGSTYVQSQDEWVLLVRGSAVLTIEGNRVELAAGDYVFLPAGVSHAVERTSEQALWLAVHLHPEQAGLR